MRDLPRRILSWSNYCGSDKLRASSSIVAILFSNSWIRIPVLGLVYFVIGYGSTFLVHPTIQFWRLAAWVASAVVYVAHVAYEHFRLENSPPATSIHVEVCAQCHPFFTGKQRLVDTAGRVDRFRRKYQTEPAATPKA